MNSTLNSLVAEPHQSDPVGVGVEHRRGRGAPGTSHDRALTRWVSMSRAALNQAKMAAPRPISSSSTLAALTGPTAVRIDFGQRRGPGR